MYRRRAEGMGGGWVILIVTIKFTWSRLKVQKCSYLPTPPTPHRQLICSQFFIVPHLYSAGDVWSPSVFSDNHVILPSNKIYDPLCPQATNNNCPPLYLSRIYSTSVGSVSWEKKASEVVTKSGVVIKHFNTCPLSKSAAFFYSFPFFENKIARSIAFCAMNDF